MTPDEWADWIANHDDVAELERALTADPALASARTTLGNTLLHEACWHKKLPYVELLVGAGADVNARGDLGRTPLHCAVHDAPPDEALPIVQFLLAHRAMPELEDAAGFTVAEYAKREIWDDPNEVLSVLGETRVEIVRAPSDFEGTVAHIEAIRREGETIRAVQRAIDAFRDGTRFDLAQAPDADAQCLGELQRILDTIAATSFADAARALLRERWKPAHAARLVGAYRDEASRR
jgi:hypothetical protein